MRDIWFFSDHHFLQESILHFTLQCGTKVRPEFSSLDEMNETLIERWNASIKPQDIVWHGGDIAYGWKKFKEHILPRLNGKLRIVLGNHDDAFDLVNSKRFEKIVAIRRFDEFGFHYSHLPVQVDSLWNWKLKKTMVNVHGHIHRHNSPPGPYMNVSVEKTDYRPLHLDEIRERIKVFDGQY